MKVTKNGIPIDSQRGIPKIRVKRANTSDYHNFKRFATMHKLESGLSVWVMVPVAHEDFKNLRMSGWSITDVWDKPKGGGGRANST